MKIPCCVEEDIIIQKLLNDDRLELIAECAYILATIKHETANTFLPISEYGLGKGKKYGKQDPTTQRIYYGRGYVQLTWKENYEKAGRMIGKDLVSNPDLAKDKNIAYEIIVEGMIRGLFTGKKLRDYLKPPYYDYIGARKIINGTDKAELIAGYAEIYQKYLPQRVIFT